MAAATNPGIKEGSSANLAEMGQFHTKLECQLKEVSQLNQANQAVHDALAAQHTVSQAGATAINSSPKLADRHIELVRANSQLSGLSESQLDTALALCSMAQAIKKVENILTPRKSGK